MIGNKKTNETKTNYDVKVLKAHYIKQADKEQVISFDVIVNNINIYGMIYRAGESKKGKDYEMISFPARKGTDDNYYNHCWFPINDQLMEEIKEQISSKI